ncbi:MAG: elongation factor G, partial [Desulfobulbaceae bacterium]|nr:elongation factor G [Desulfobulbaceae bacterium]
DEEKLRASLEKIAIEDPSFTTTTDPDTGQILISGMGELHLEIITDRLVREFKVGVNVGKPQVAYKETFEGTAKAEGKFDQHTGGKGQYGHVWLEFRPMARGSGFEFENCVDEEIVPVEFITAVKKAVEAGLDSGPLLGFPVVDVKISLVDGSYHQEDSTEQAFGVAAAMAFRKGALESRPVLLEPIMKLEVILPEAYLGDVISDLNSKRARIFGMEGRDSGHQAVKAQAPLAEMFGYSTDLRSVTQGRAIFTMQFACYDKVPENIAEQIIKKVRGFV